MIYFQHEIKLKIPINVKDLTAIRHDDVLCTLRTLQKIHHKNTVGSACRTFNLSRNFSSCLYAVIYNGAIWNIVHALCSAGRTVTLERWCPVFSQPYWIVYSNRMFDESLVTLTILENPPTQVCANVKKQTRVHLKSKRVLLNNVHVTAAKTTSVYCTNCEIDSQIEIHVRCYVGLKGPEIC